MKIALANFTARKSAPPPTSPRRTSAQPAQSAQTALITRGRIYVLLATLCFLYGALQEARRAGIAPPEWTWQPGYWWQTPDQRGAAAFAHGDWAGAGQHFRHSQNSAWRAAACYRAGDLACAASAYADISTAEAHYNLGNVDARRGRLGSALKRYDAALAARPDWREADDNRRLVLALIAERTRRGEPPDGEGDPVFDPDQVIVDEKGKRGKAGAIEIEKLDPKSLAQLWLRQVRNDPGEFLRLRFADEISRSKEPR